MTSRVTVICIDIGGTKIIGQRRDTLLAPTESRLYPTPSAAQPSALAGAVDRGAALAAGRAALLDVVGQLCRDLLQQAAEVGDQVVGIGVGTAGQVDTVSGTVIDANENLVGWKDTPVAAALTEAFGLPVFIENDVRAMALGESYLGAGREFDHLLYVAVGTGIGGAIVLNGRVWHGAHFSAGEIGYLLADPVHTIEQVAAGPALEALYAQRSGQALALKEVAALAATGDPLAVEVIVEHGARRLGDFLAPVAFFVDPQALVVGGGVAEMGDLWWLPFTEAFYRFPQASIRQVQVRRAQLGGAAVMAGAGVLALRGLGYL